MPPKHVSPGKRSRTGCGPAPGKLRTAAMARGVLSIRSILTDPDSLTCRERKLKCDEKKPVCGQCSKTGRRCQPSSGIVFRHHQNASMNGNLGASEDDDLGSFYAYKDTFTKDNVWLPVSGPVKFIHIKDPYAEDEIMLDLDRLDQAPPVAHAHSHSLSEPRNVAAHHSHSRSEGRNSSPLPGRALADLPGLDRSGRNKSISSFTHSAATSSPSSAIHSRNLASPLSPFSVSAVPFTATPGNDQATRFPSVSHTASPISWGNNSGRYSMGAPFQVPRPIYPVETDEEVLFLLRHFNNVVGFSMDLFDCGRFFSDYVPTRALLNPLLKNACCAYAAKQLAMVRGKRMTVGAFVSPPARTEYWKDPGQVDWFKYAQKYYDGAISYLLEEVNLVSTKKDAGEAWQEGMVNAGKSDDLMAATAILCEYEAIDASGEAWQRHLNGTKSLLDIAEAGMKPLDHIEISQRRPRFSRARRAIFWNFARQDYAAALITESQARLDVNNHQLWRDAGLELDADGRLIPNKGTWIEYSEGGISMREDMISNGLIFILSKICNYLSTAERLVPPPAGLSARELSQFESEMPLYGLSQQMLSHRWTMLAEEVDAWYDNLPDTFKPIGRSRSASPYFPEIWFAVGMCAASIANYHMARILLLINKPQESTMTRSTVSSRLDSYRNIVPEVEWHSREICGIALARPETAVRIFMIIPLFYAGQCLTNWEERKVVANILRAIEKDLGWTTEYRVQQLLRIWGMSESDLSDHDGIGP